MTTRIALLLGIVALGVAGCAKTVLYDPTAPTAATLDVNAFANIVNPGGSASRELTLTASGTIAVTLSSTTPAGTALGVGIGIPRTNNQCALSTSVVTTAGSSAQISQAADGGSYCVKVYDPGTLTAPAAFTISISRP